MVVLVSFRLGAEIFLLPLNQVERIVQIAAMRPVPGAPPDLLGILTFRGKALPVLDLRPRLGFAATPFSLTHHLILVNSTEHLQRAALLVDESLDVITADTLLPATELIPPLWIHALPWMSGALILAGQARMCLNIDALLTLVPLEHEGNDSRSANG